MSTGSRWSAALSLVAALALTSGDAHAAARLLRDINPHRVILSSYPSNFFSIAGRSYFVAGGSLFATDGMQTTPLIVSNSGGLPSLGSVGGVRLGDFLLFVFQGALWRSDGTADGTASITGGYHDWQSLVALPSRALFLQLVPDEALELWTSDGTAAGTVRLHTYQAPSFIFGVPNLIVSAGRAYFVANDGEHGRELWTSDGTEAGTYLVRDLVPGTGSSQFAYDLQAAEADGTLFLAVADRGTPTLWRTDGTADETRPVVDGARAPVAVANLVAIGDRVFFTAGDGSGGTALWVSNGSAETRQIATIGSGTSGYYPYTLAAAGSELYFIGNDAEHGTELWRTDGGAVELVADIRPGAEGASIAELTPLADGVVFSADDGTSGSELWRAQNGVAGARRVSDINPGPSGSQPTNLTSTGDAVVFAADDGSHGREPWRSDGSESGTALLINLDRDDQPASSNAGSFVDLDGRLLFIADDGQRSALWTSSGGAASTHTVGDEVPLGVYVDAALVRLGDRVLFAGYGASGVGLWQSDGSATGTSMIAGPFFDIERGEIVRAGESVFFSAAQDAGQELWRTDGTAEGTVQVADINPGKASSFPRHLTAVGDRVFFSADDGRHGRELWTSDGTTGGTHLVRDLNVDGGAISGFPTTLVVVGDLVYFAAYDETHGGEPWVSDGTEAGTTLVRDIAPGPESSLIATLNGVAVNDRVFFVAHDPVHGLQLWTSNGAESGTRIVRLIEPGLSFDLEDLVSIGRQVFFTANDGAHGNELWRSDGTADGTRMVADLNRGAAGSAPTALSRVGSHVVFDACVDDVGCELWETDGQRIQLLADVVPGPESSYPDRAVESGGHLYFAATTTTTGYEPFVLDLCSGDCDGRGSVSVNELVRAVSIAIGSASLDACSSADVDGDGRVSIADLIATVGASLDGCHSL